VTQGGRLVLTSARPAAVIGVDFHELKPMPASG
jgi:hypothetical protein